MTTHSPSYPIGKFTRPEGLTSSQRNEAILGIEELPAQLLLLLRNATAADLAKQYREGSWTVRELVHHLADSHMNAFIRFKLALTEDNPTIRPYEQDGWALLPDVARVEIEPSMMILRGLHQRWAVLLRTLNAAQWQRTFYHPEWDHNFTLEQAVAQYAWHSKHHMGHIKIALGA
jgi:hypothetical protein